MKLSIEQPKLAALIARVIDAVESRNTIPILGNILLKAGGDTLTATATDLDIQCTSTAEATVTDPGSTTVSASMFAQIVGKLAKGKLVTLESKGLTLHITSGRSELELATLPIDDFPKIATDQYESQLTSSQEDIKRLFDLSAFAMSTEETRFYLQGVYLHTIAGKLRTVTTDGHRLAQIDSLVDADIAGVIVPRKTVGLVKKLLGEGDLTIKVSVGKVLFDLGHTVVISKTIEGTYPDYARIIPKDHVTEATVSAADVKQAAALVSLVSGERTKAVKISVSGAIMALEVNAGIDKGLEEVDCEFTGPDIAIGVNSKYLADVLQACNGDQAVIRFNGTGDPIVIKPSEDDLALFVVMPMRING